MKANTKKYVEITIDTIERETEKAYLIEGEWFPKSQFIYVMNWNHLSIKDWTVKQSDRKAIYTMLCPLWLYMKKPMRFRESDTLDNWITAYNKDDRVDFEYESFKALNRNEYNKLFK